MLSVNLKKPLFDRICRHHKLLLQEEEICSACAECVGDRVETGIEPNITASSDRDEPKS